MEPKRFQLVDSEGKPHEYILTLHHASEGAGIALQIMALVSGPIAEALVALLGSEGALQRFAEQGVADISLDDLGAALGDVSLGDLATQLAKALGDKTTAKLITSDLMKHAHRDGKPLSIQTNYDLAYTGNYLELFKLAMEVVKLNGFLPFAPT